MRAAPGGSPPRQRDPASDTAVSCGGGTTSTGPRAKSRPGHAPLPRNSGESRQRGRDARVAAGAGLVGDSPRPTAAAAADPRGSDSWRGTARRASCCSRPAGPATGRVMPPFSRSGCRAGFPRFAGKTGEARKLLLMEREQGSSQQRPRQYRTRSRCRGRSPSLSIVPARRSGGRRQPRGKTPR